MPTLFFKLVFFFKQKTAYELRISDWSSDVCSSDLDVGQPQHRLTELFPADEFTADGGAEALREQRRGTLLSRSLEAAIDVVTRQYRIVLECAIGSIEIATADGLHDTIGECRNFIFRLERARRDRSNKQNGKAAGREKGWQYG